MLFQGCMGRAACISWLFLIWGCTASQIGKQGGGLQQEPHLLAGERSPLLLRHDPDPVRWQPWDPGVYADAQRKGGLLFLHLGRFTSGEGLRMQQEVFRDTMLAMVLNRAAVPVLIDADEQPDLAMRYRRAGQRLNGALPAYPISVIAAPDGSPLWVSSYAGRDQVYEALVSWYDAWQQAPALVRGRIDAWRGQEGAAAGPQDYRNFTWQEAAALAERLLAEADLQYGGLREQPKQLRAEEWMYLLQHQYLMPDAQALRAVRRTLDQLALGGLYDHLGGGFFRQSDDPAWRAPHFEKELSGNARMISLYAQAYQLTRDPLYEQVLYESLGFLRQDLAGPEGAYFAGLQEYSEGEAGRYYVWPRIDFDALLGRKSYLLAGYYNVTREGNWQRGQNILYRTLTDAELAAAYGLSPAVFQHEIAQLKGQMQAARAKRVRPAQHRVAVTAWNALAIQALTDAYRALGDSAWLVEAEETATFLERHALHANGRLTRAYVANVAYGDAFLDDYAYLADAWIDLYQASFHERWLYLADSVLQYALTHFYRPGQGSFSYNSDVQAGPAGRIQSFGQDILPDPEAVLCRVLSRLGVLLGKPEYQLRAREMLARVRQPLLEGQLRSPAWNAQVLEALHPPARILLLGRECHRLLGELEREYTPFVLISGGKTEGGLALHQGRLLPGRSAGYLCGDSGCEGPYADMQALRLRLAPPGRAQGRY
jgi:hypothetical protein